MFTFPAGVSSSTQNSEEQSASLDLTVTYDYTCPEDTSSGDPVKSMEELSGLFSFKVRTLFIVCYGYNVHRMEDTHLQLCLRLFGLI